MDLGVVLQCTPPAARVIDLARRAEMLDFTHVWTFDSHILWEEPYVIYSKILDETRKVVVGPMVTNPATPRHHGDSIDVRHLERNVRGSHRHRDRSG